LVCETASFVRDARTNHLFSNLRQVICFELVPFLDNAQTHVRMLFVLPLAGELR